MTHGTFQTPDPVNEPVRGYAPGSPERKSLQAELKRMRSNPIEVPLLVGGEKVETGNTAKMRSPHNHGMDLGIYHQARPEDVTRAINAATDARADWQALPWEERATVFLRAADLLAGPWRDRVNASTMLGQSKTCHQAEIDAACELIDFWRFNVRFMERIYSEQPQSSPGCWNRMEHRPLDGFVFAITPFNFSSIAANLPSAPAMLGNTTIWKPASTSVLSNYYLSELMIEAGVPPGVINFLPGRGAAVGDPVMADSRLAGIHFTGSTGVFQGIWRSVAENLPNYAQYPRLVGETGGKDFVMALPDSDPRTLAVALARGSFEYQGQKCSAASRAYVPKSIWPEVLEQLEAITAEMAMGDPEDFTNFLGAVIDEGSYKKLSTAIEGARADASCKVVVGGECDASEGWFIRPTVIETADPKHDLMRTELFGPVLTIFPYEDARVDETVQLCADTSEYALTGAVFGTNRTALRKAMETLRFAAGNFYVNDKPTGAVVGQQPFGGARASGTNDKAGSILILLRWVSPRTIKETFVPPTDWRYPFLGKDD